MTRKPVLTAAVLLAASAAVLHVIIGRGLDRAIRERLAQIAKNRLGVELAVGSVAANLFTGSAYVRDVTLGNPPGFENPALLEVADCGVRVGLPALIKGSATDIRSARARNVRLAIERNATGQLNLAAILDSLRAPRQQAVRAGRRGYMAQTDAANTAVLPPITIRHASADMKIEHTDRCFADRELKASITVSNLILRDFATFGDADSLSGRLIAQGWIEAGSSRAVFVFHIKLAPMPNPEQLSFDLTGSIEGLNAAAFAPYSTEVGIEDGRVDIAAKLVCRKGEFEPGASSLNLTFTRLRLAKPLEARFGSFGVPDKLVVPVPIEGTVLEPKLDLKLAITKAITSDANIEALIRSATRNKASDSAAATGSVSNAPSPEVDAQKSKNGDRRLKVPEELLRLSQ